MSLPCPVNPALKELPVYQPGRPIEEVARELGLPPHDIIKLASNENPLGPSPAALAAMQRVLANINLYPDGNAFHLKKKLAAKLGVSPAHLILGNGSNEIIEFIGHAFMNRETEVVVSQFCFAIYPLVATIFNAPLVTVPAKNFGHDLPGMLKAITAETRVVFIANPNNPTGTLVSNRELSEFADAVPEHVLLVMDEAYIEFLDEPPDFVSRIRDGQRANLLLMRTFSKIFGLAGLRIGYGIAHPELVATLEKVRQPFNINAIAQAGALAALDDDAHFQKTRTNNAEGLKYYEAELRALSVEFVPSAANFILARVGDGRRIFDAMQRLGVIVRPMGGYRLAEWIRISIGTPPENRRCIQALRTALGR